MSMKSIRSSDRTVPYAELIIGQVNLRTRFVGCIPAPSTSMEGLLWVFSWTEGSCHHSIQSLFMGHIAQIAQGTRPPFCGRNIWENLM